MVFAIFLIWFLILIPPSDWDEVAYGTVFPIQAATRGSLGYIAEYGVYSAFSIIYHLIAILGYSIGLQVYLGKVFAFYLAILFCTSPLYFAKNKRDFWSLPCSIFTNL